MRASMAFGCGFRWNVHYPARWPFFTGSWERMPLRRVGLPSPTILLGGTAIAGIAAARILHQLGPYLAGRRGHDAVAQQYEFAWMIILGVCFGIALLGSIAFGLVLIYRLLPGQTGRKKELCQTAALAVVIASVVGLCLVTLRPAHTYFLEGFSGYMAHHADLTAIRAWSHGLVVGNELVPQSNWPACVSALSPERVSVEQIGGDREVNLIWGGGLMHWGLAVREKPVRPACVPWLWVLELDERSFVWVDAQ